MRKWTLILLVALAVPLFAGIYTNVRRPARLEIDGASYGNGWSISSPTVSSSSGYLSYDITGKSPRVTFEKRKGPHSTWTFLAEKHYHKEFLNKGTTPDSDLEVVGSELKLRATEGPFAGWYLARLGGELVLVKNPAWAATLLLVQKEADVVHK